jgi:hypothetical protein
MIVYNVTINLDEAIAEEWLTWMKSIHIPLVMDTGCFEGYKILKLLNERTDFEGPTFAVQYFSPDMKTMQKYSSQFAPSLQKEVKDKYGERLVAFRTLLEEV